LKGTFLLQKRHGEGEAVYRNGTSYVGAWEDDKREGQGKYSSPEGASYDGQWKNDLAQGYGTFKFGNGSEYMGDFYEGKRQGMGKYSKGNGDIYSGDHFRNKFHGQGTIVYGRGGQYKGPFFGGKRHGKNGEFTDENKTMHRGKFIKNKMDGEMYVERPASQGGVESQKGLWDTGDFIDWTSYAINPTQTEAFIKRFQEDDNEYNEQYAMLVARRLPLLPHGIDGGDTRVEPIVARILREVPLSCVIILLRSTYILTVTCCLFLSCRGVV
jgi:hypothetical protein